MKKLLLLALVAAPMVMSAQDAPKAEFESLTTNWTVSEGIPALSDGRQATFANGKCYIQNKVTQSLVVVDENGAVAQSDMATSTHAGITRDDAGNVIGERIRPLLMRETYRSEVFLLAELCGFEVRAIYRGYKGDREDLRDITTASMYRSNLIWLLRKK